MSEYGDYRVTVFDRNGVPLAELDVEFHCVWADNEQGPGDFVISARYDPKCAPHIIKPGNYVVFDHAHHGSWGGVIMPHDDISLSGNGELTVRMREASIQFARRRAPLYNFEGGNIVLQGPASAVLKTMIHWCNLKQDTRLREGDINAGDKQTQLKLVNAMWSDLLDKFIKRNKVRVWTEPARDEQNLLIFKVNAAKRAVTNPDAYYPLQEDINIETPSGEFYRRGNELKNDILYMNEAADDGGYLEYIAEDSPSQEEYGLWQWTETFGTDEAAALEEMATSELEKNSQLREKPILTAIESEESPDTFLHLRNGARIRVLIHSVGLWYGDRGASVFGNIATREVSTSQGKRCILTAEYD